MSTNDGEQDHGGSSVIFWIVGGGLVALLTVGLLFSFLEVSVAPVPGPPPVAVVEEAPAKPDEKAGNAAEPADGGGTFLDAFNAKGGAESDATGPLLSDGALEKKFGELLKVQERLRALGEQAMAEKEAGRKKQFDSTMAEREQLLQKLNAQLASFEKELGQARKARPMEPVPAWLTGEVLILIGGEPEEIQRHLRRAIVDGLARPRVYASLALTQSEANQFEEAFQTAAKALDLDAIDRYGWHAYIRTAFYNQRVAEVIARLDRTFTGQKPDWAAEVRAEASARQELWQTEQKLRAAEAKADNLPRVRLLIEHRRFARDDKGNPTTRIESTGRGEVVLELFEDQAPNTVANFLTLVVQKKYDATRFYLAEAATLVEGGDVKSRERDPAEDGTGSPGYLIPDEVENPRARCHFRGSISMVNNGPNTAGSRFFLTLVPMPEMDGQYTVFGRVLQGQEVIDRITRGRTNPNVGRHGRIMPGDLLVRAEILRKRDHDYRVTKVEP